MNDYDRANERLTRLEQEIVDLRRYLDEIHSRSPLGQMQPPSPTSSSDEPSPEPITSPPVARPGRLAKSVGNDAWIGKVGIGLVIIGALFLFKLAIDSGWITPETRVGIGALLGLGLIALGLNLRPAQSLLRQLLPGGGIAILHLTLFAGGVMYELISLPIAWFALLGVSAFGFWSARRIAHPLLAWIALIGGLQGVFSLGLGTGIPLMAYAYINALVALALYLAGVSRRPSLPWGTFLLGAGAVALVSANDLGGNVIRLSAIVLPVIGSLLAIWRAPVTDKGYYRNIQQLGLGLANFVMPLVGIAWVTHILDWAPLLKGIALIFAGILVGFSGRWVIRDSVTQSSGETNPQISPDTFAVPIALLTVVAGYISFQNEGRLLVLVGIAFTIAWIAFMQNWQGLKTIGVLVGIGVISGIYNHLGWQGYATVPFLNVTCIVVVAAISCAALLAWQRRQVAEATIYWIVAYGGLLGFILHQLGGTPGGQALVSLIWLAFGILLFVIGLRHRQAAILNAGRTTLGLVVGKLFLIDLAGLSTGVKTVIFLLVGGLFLGVSYVSARAKQHSQQ